MELADAERQREHRRDVEQRVADDHRESSEQHRDGHLDAFLALDGGAERGRFRDFQAHVQPERDQHGADDERHAPSPAGELFVGEPEREAEEQAVRRQKADGRPELRKHAEQPALALRRVFGREQRCAAPFAAEPDALSEVQHAQQDRRETADGVVARHEADQRGPKVP